MNVKIAALPCLCVDVFEGTKKVYPGGEALNFAVHAAEFTGVDVSLIGAVGQDEYGQKILDTIGYRRIDTSCVHIDKKRPTAYNMTYLTPEGDRYYKEDSWHGGAYDAFKLSKADIKELSLSDVVFVNYSAPCFKQVTELKEELGFKLAVDFDVCRDFDAIEALCPIVDFVMISGSEELLPKFKEFSEKYEGFFNMTLAEKGSVTFAGGEEYRAAAVPPDEIIDSTGCGDSYHAAFVCSYMVDKDIQKAMQVASELAALTLEHYGGF